MSQNTPASSIPAASEATAGKSPTVVITDTERLSALADALLDRSGNPALTKNTVLNLIAGTLAGAKTNWGGLKAHATVVVSPGVECAARAIAAAQNAAAQLSHSDDQSGAEVDEERGTYWLDADHLAILVPTPDAKQNKIKARIDMIEIPILIRALESGGRFASREAKFERIDDRLRITHLDRGEADRIEVDFEVFHHFLFVRHARILEAILSTRVGGILHRAFTAVAEDQGEKILFEVASEFPFLEGEIHAESAETRASRIDDACRDATWAYIGDRSENYERRMAMINGSEVELANSVIDTGRELIGEVLRETFENENAG